MNAFAALILVAFGVWYLEVYKKHDNSHLTQMWVVETHASNSPGVVLPFVKPNESEPDKPFFHSLAGASVWVVKDGCLYQAAKLNVNAATFHLPWSFDCEEVTVQH